MRNPYDIIKTARVTEKGTLLAEKNQYLFEVDTKATKQEIREAIEKIFKKSVTRVNTLRVKGKAKRARVGRPGRTAQWKKAIVTLKEGEKLDFA
jgi:large subunit ribosomal protein L23